MNCHLCGQDFLPVWTLSNVWTRQTLCPTCKIEFVKRGECEGCEDCGKPGPPLCPDCQNWRNQGRRLVTHPLFLYQTQAKAFMKRYKFLGDTALLDVFKTELKKVKVKQDWIVPVPLSPERLGERRFNQAELIARMMRGTGPACAGTDGRSRIQSSDEARTTGTGQSVSRHSAGDRKNDFAGR